MDSLYDTNKLMIAGAILFLIIFFMIVAYNSSKQKNLEKGCGCNDSYYNNNNYTNLLSQLNNYSQRFNLSSTIIPQPPFGQISNGNGTVVQPVNGNGTVVQPVNGNGNVSQPIGRNRNVVQPINGNENVDQPVGRNRNQNPSLNPEQVATISQLLAQLQSLYGSSIPLTRTQLRNGLNQVVGVSEVKDIKDKTINENYKKLSKKKSKKIKKRSKKD